MLIGIEKKTLAYTPEAFAYQQHLLHKGHEIVFLPHSQLLNEKTDLNIIFMGSDPFYSRNNSISKTVHEYHSLSIPPWAHAKNLAKSLLNRRPQGRIFLSEEVKQDLLFPNDAPYIYRDMGVDQAFFREPAGSKSYHVVYAGSIGGRKDLLQQLLTLAVHNRVLLIGSVPDEYQATLQQASNITLTGRVGRDQLPQLYQQALYGLNFTPNLYPFNIQTSTKTLEYVSSGLGVLSNRYQWAEKFFARYGITPRWIEEHAPGELPPPDNFDRHCLAHLEWEYLLERSGFHTFIEQVAQT